MEKDICDYCHDEIEIGKVRVIWGSTLCPKCMADNSVRLEYDQEPLVYRGSGRWSRSHHHP